MAGRAWRAALVAALAGVCAAGCASSPFEAREALAVRHIASAEETGVEGRELEETRALLDQAEDAEERALEDRGEAQEELADARRDVARLEGDVTVCESRLQQTIAALSTAEAEVKPMETELEALAQRGLTPEEGERLIGPRVQLLRQRVEGLRHQRRAHELDLELQRLELRSARARADAAEAQLRASEERLQLAGVLYDFAKERAETLELELLTNQHARVRERLQRLRP